MMKKISVIMMMLSCISQFGCMSTKPGAPTFYSADMADAGPPMTESSMAAESAATTISHVR